MDYSPSLIPATLLLAMYSLGHVPSQHRSQCQDALTTFIKSIPSILEPWQDQANWENEHGYFKASA